jgi:hypothetical protein
MTIYEIVADTANTYGLRNKATGQFEHGHFPSMDMLRSFFKLHFGWNTSYRLEDRYADRIRFASAGATRKR